MAYELELISIRCNDAQEWFDEACLLVNDSMVWRYPAMQTGLTYRFRGEARISFENTLTVELREEDQLTNHDRIGTLTLSEHEIEAMISIEHHPFTHIFSRDRGIVGDASYTLTYDLWKVETDETVMSGKFFLFFQRSSRGGEFVRHSYGRGPDHGYPLSTREFWRGYPDSWLSSTPGAALYYDVNQKFYLFSTNEYVRHSYRREPDSTYPRSIRRWSGLPEHWHGVSAALYYPVTQKFYLFLGSEYVRHSYGRGPDPDYPLSIREHWSGFPDSWHPSDIYAACYCSYNGKFYLFGNRDEYVRHSYGRGPDRNYPRKVNEVWSGLPRSWIDEGFETFPSILYYPHFF